MSAEEHLFVFELAGEDYAIDVMKVGEVIKSGDKTTTSLPNSPEFVKGIINVRGQVIPLIDLEDRFGLTGENSEFIVLFELNGSTSGILVDDVHEVMKVDDKRIKDAPEVLRDRIHQEYVDDVALLENDRMIIILDLESGFNEEEQMSVGQISDSEGGEGDDEIEEVSQEDIQKRIEENL